MPTTVDLIRELLADGKPRTAGEITEGIGQGKDFITRRQIGREVQRALLELRRAEAVLRLSYEEGYYKMEAPFDVARFVDSSTVAPICLPCWRKKWSMTETPPHVTGFPGKLCSLCGKRTNHGGYASISEIEERRAARSAGGS